MHWLSALLMIACVAAVLVSDAFDKGTASRAFIMQMHFAAGGLLGLLLILRLGARAGTQPPQTEPMPGWMAKASVAAHGVLYALILLVPVLGYVGVSGRGVPINLFDLVSVPPLPVSKEVAHDAKELHEGAAWLLVTVVGLHAAAAVYHAVVLKDRVLARMLGR